MYSMESQHGQPLQAFLVFTQVIKITISVKRQIFVEPNVEPSISPDRMAR